MKRPIPPPPIHWSGKGALFSATPSIQQKPAFQRPGGTAPIAPPPSRFAGVPPATAQPKTSASAAFSKVPAPFQHRPSLPAAPPSGNRLLAPPPPPTPYRAASFTLQMMKRKAKQKEDTDDESSEEEAPTTVKVPKKWLFGVDVMSDLDEELARKKKFVEVPVASLKLIRDLVGAAKLGGGKKSTHSDLDLLEKIITHDLVRAARPDTSEATYAIGKAGNIIYASGPLAFGEAVEAAVASLSLGLTSEHIGSRKTFTHGEIHVVSAKSGVTSVYATQPCCLFCYGYLQLNNVANPGLRESLFPKGWIHPDQNLKLTQKGYMTAAVGSFAWVGITEEQRTLYRVE